MIDISVSQLINQIDQSYFTLYAEWEDTWFKIILLRSSMIPLSGKMYIENASYFLHHLDESFDTYLEKTKHAFSGENSEIQFFLQDNDTFTWKQQNILTRGEITLNPLSNVLTISDTLKQISEHYQKYQKRILELEKENESLNKVNTKLTADMEEMIIVKNNMEEDLYRRFLLLLNTKKKKIRELQEALDSNKKVAKSLYDEATDESDMSEVESENMQEISEKYTDIKKHKEDCEGKQKATLKNNEKHFKWCNNSSSRKTPSPEPSTSKDGLTLRNTDMQYIIKSTQFLNSSEEESEGDLFS